MHFMGLLSMDGTVVLVVPGYFVCAGILLYTALIAAVVGMYRARAPVYISFACVCLFSAALTVTTAASFVAQSDAAAVEALRWQFAFSVPLVISLFMFVAYYTDAPRMGRWFAASTGIGVACLLANALLPLGTRFSAITACARSS